MEIPGSLWGWHAQRTANAALMVHTRFPPCPGKRLTVWLFLLLLPLADVHQGCHQGLRESSCYFQTPLPLLPTHLHAWMLEPTISQRHPSIPLLRILLHPLPRPLALFKWLPSQCDIYRSACHSCVTSRPCTFRCAGDQVGHCGSGAGKGFTVRAAAADRQDGLGPGDIESVQAPRHILKLHRENHGAQGARSITIPFPWIKNHHPPPSPLPLPSLPSFTLFVHQSLSFPLRSPPPCCCLALPRRSPPWPLVALPDWLLVRGEQTAWRCCPSGATRSKSWRGWTTSRGLSVSCGFRTI